MEERTQPTSDSRSLGAITGDLLTNAQEVIRDEVRLAKVEITDELKTAARAAGVLAAGAVLGFLALMMLMFTATWALDTVMPLWLAAAIVTLVVGTIGGILVMVGKSKVAEVNPKPEQTIETMKENAQWVRQQTQ